MTPRTVPGDSFSAIIDKVSKNAWLKNQIKTYEFIEENQFKDFSSVKEYFPTFYTKSQIENVLFQLLEDWKKENVDKEGSITVILLTITV